ncbi:hypothetical protein DKX38_024570 [Salix brachista]|uniref:Retrotransposon gag domain-containing protein n=1 Tax=Salix brachista TaxID=2182728 RepID=A0A5N5JLM3_9ROSI|nr:hypothetical protein DKX38_024570 [Salix brachista]
MLFSSSAYLLLTRRRKGGEDIKEYLLQKLGREIIHQENIDPIERGRLWEAEDVYLVLTNPQNGSLNPAFSTWSKKDNSVLSWLYASITEKLVSTVLNLETSKQVWDALQARFSSTSRSRVAFLKRQLQTISQGNRNCLSYIEEAKLFSDQLSAAGKPVDEQDLISYLLSGLKPQFMPFITAFTFATRETELSLDDF